MPQVEGVPQSLNLLLESAYSSALKKFKSKSRASRVAWSAAKQAGWSKSADGKWSKDGLSTRTFSDKEFAMAKDFTIFKTGHWNGETFTENDLDEMVKSFKKEEPIPVIVGHSSDYKGHTMIPAFGQIMGGLKRVGSNLVACGVEFNDALAEWIKQGFYNQRSIELTRDNKRVIALGMLGAVPPAVKGLPGNQDALSNLVLQFSQMQENKVITFAEDDLDDDMTTPAEGAVDADMVDEVEGAAVDDTFKSLSECCARFLEDIEKLLEGGKDEQRIMQELQEFQMDCITTLNLHNQFIKKLEKMEESNEEYLDKRSGWKSFAQAVKSLFNKRKEQSNVDAKLEQEFKERIAFLEAQVKEFQQEDDATVDDAVKAAEAEALAKQQEEDLLKAEADAKVLEDAAAIDRAKQAEVKELCDELVKQAKMTPAMRTVDEPIMIDLLKKSGKAFKSFTQKYDKPVVPIGEVVAINQNNDQRPQVIAKAEQYVKQHPKEFANVEPAIRIQRALFLRSNGQIKFEDDK